MLVKKDEMHATDSLVVVVVVVVVVGHLNIPYAVFVLECTVDLTCYYFSIDGQAYFGPRMKKCLSLVSNFN